MVKQVVGHLLMAVLLFLAALPAGAARAPEGYDGPVPAASADPRAQAGQGRGVGMEEAHPIDRPKDLS